LYEPPFNLDRLDPSRIDQVQAAVDAGDPDRALQIVFSIVGIADAEAQILHSLEPVWERLRDGVRQAPRELRVIDQVTDRLRSFTHPISRPSTCTARTRTLRSSPPVTKSLTDCPRPNSRSSLGSATSRSLSTPRPSPKRSWPSPQLTTTEPNREPINSLTIPAAASTSAQNIGCPHRRGPHLTGDRSGRKAEPAGA
jgi:hypothetical protein